MVQTILLVEDNSAVRRLLKMALVKAGYEALEAPSAAEGLAGLENGISAVLLDLTLPDNQTDKLIERLRHRDGSPIPWLVTSAFELREAESRFGPLRERFIPKPFDPWAVVARIEALIEGPSPAAQ